MTAIPPLPPAAEWFRQTEHVIPWVPPVAWLLATVLMVLLHYFIIQFISSIFGQTLIDKLASNEEDRGSDECKKSLSLTRYYYNLHD